MAEGIAVVDIRTIILALGIGNVGFALLMAGYIRGSTSQDGLALWMWSRLMLGVTQFIGWLAPGPWGDSLQAIGCVAGVAMELAAYCTYFECGRWRRAVGPATALTLLVMLFVSFHRATYVQLLGLACVISAMYAAAMAFVLLRPRSRKRSLLQKIMGGSDALFAVAMAAGGWAGLSDPSQVLGANGLHTLAGLAAYLMMIVNGAGFLLLCKQKADDQMTLLATTDFLTGLANRRAFFQQAEGARQLALRLRKPIALLMLDIDHFKQLNDRFGHATGDEALVLFADTARATLREHDIMGRLGGEEFALALPGTDLPGGVLAAERLRQAVIDAPLCAAGTPHRMTVSIGVVLVEPNEALTAALARADQALYAAKSGGRNRVEVGPPVLKRA
nr:GGDEF domain-containing protein [Massilia solisilvae]